MNAAANGHVAEGQQDEAPPLRGGEDRMETGMPRVRLPRRASTVPAVSAAPDARELAPQSNGDLHGHASSGSPSPNALGNSRRPSATVSKATVQGPREVQVSALLGPALFSFKACNLWGELADADRPPTIAFERDQVYLLPVI